MEMEIWSGIQTSKDFGTRVTTKNRRKEERNICSKDTVSEYEISFLTNINPQVLR
jgi:hypothetical protein